MRILMSRVAATAAAAAMVFGVVGLTSVRAADYLPPPASRPPDYGPPPAYAPPPVYDVAPVEVMPVYPPPIYVVPPVAYPYGYPRYTYAPIYHGAARPRGRFSFHHW